jgi:urease accessory protein
MTSIDAILIKMPYILDSMGQNLSNWQGKLNLVYAHRLGKTELIANSHQAPLKVQRPFYPEGAKVCHSVILHTAGGIVGGDRLSTNIHLHPHSHSLITTASAGKVYRSNGLQSQQTINIHIDADACLEWLPQETIVFNGAMYRQDMRIELATGAHYLGWEIIRFGRSARGEKFISGSWRSHTEVWQNQVPVWIDRQWLPGNEQVFHSHHGLAGLPVVGSLVWISSAVTPEIVQRARHLLTSKSLGGVSRLQTGFLCRYRGDSTSEVRYWFTLVWQMLRNFALDSGNYIPRVWQI